MLHTREKGLDMVFVYPSLAQKFDICLGSAYIIAYLLQYGYSAEQYLTDIPVNINECAKQILSRNPLIVGFTVYDPTYGICSLIARALKEKKPDIIIVFGGPTPTVQAQEIMRNNRFVDICMRNEGEEATLELLSEIYSSGYELHRARLDKIKGITFKRDGIIINTSDRNTFLVNRNTNNFLDKYPSPYLSGVIKSNIGIITARGCNQHCTYCNCTVLSRSLVSTHSVSRVIEELQYIQETKKDNTWIQIFDDAFTLLPNRAQLICEQIIEKGIRLPFACMTRCDKVDEKLLTMMKEAGFKSIGFSLESAVPRLLRIIGKVQPPGTEKDPLYEKEKEFVENFKKNIAFAKKIGIETVFASIMLGLPTETPEEAQETINLIKSMEGQINCYTHNVLQVYPGTPLFNEREKYGIKVSGYGSRIFYKTVHSYDPYKIKMAPFSYTIKDYTQQNRSCLNTMSLSVRGKHPSGFFNKAILFSDILGKELVLWLQENLAIGGEFIQIYSSPEKAKENYGQNDLTMAANNSITNRYSGYYKESEEGGVTSFNLIRTYRWDGPDNRISIKYISTVQGLSQGFSGTVPLEYICSEYTEADALMLHHYLVEMSQSKNTVNHLFDEQVTPYFSGLCRWKGNGANCITSDIAIIDSENNVRCCLNGAPIGAVGMPFPEIQKNLESMRCEAAVKRSCSSCNKSNACTKCIFTDPISQKQFCSLKKNYDVENAAEFIECFNYIKNI